MFAFDGLVEVDHLADIRSFFDIRLREKTTLKPVDDDIAELVRGEVKVFGGELNFVADAGVGDGAVVGAKGHAEFGVEHFSEVVIGDAGEFGHGLEIAGQTNFDGDTAFGDKLGELFDVKFAVKDAFILDAVGAEEVVAMTDAISVEGGDRLEDAFRAEGFACVDGFAEEVAMDVAVGFDVIVGGVSVFLSGEIEADDGDAFIAFDRDDGFGERVGGEAIEAGGGGVGVDIIKTAEVLGEVSCKHPHGASDDAVFKGGFFAIADIGEVVEFFFGFGESSVHMAEDLGHIESGAAVELGSETDFDVADAFGKVIASEFIGATFEGFACLEHSDGVLKAAQVFAEVGVSGFEDGFFESVFGVRREGDFLFLGEFDQGFDADGTVEMEMKIRFGDLADKFGGKLVIFGHQISSCWVREGEDSACWGAGCIVRDDKRRQAERSVSVAGIAFKLTEASGLFGF